jgi:hypothetical protein
VQKILLFVNPLNYVSSLPYSFSEKEKAMRILISIFILCCTNPIFSMGLVPAEKTNGWDESWLEYKAGLQESLAEQRVPEDLERRFGQQTVGELLIDEINAGPIDSAQEGSSERLLEWIFKHGYQDSAGRALLSSVREMRELHVVAPDQYEEHWNSRGFSALVRCLFAFNLNGTDYSVAGPGGASALHYLALNASLLEEHRCFVREAVGRVHHTDAELDRAAIERDLVDALQDRGLLEHNGQLVDPSKDISPLSIYMAACRLEDREPEVELMLLLTRYMIPLHCTEE